ncbi:MAG: 50S ribosomal protein L6 [Nanoarchaeota archaeon]|nr:50S ribosomal protein L6 [Nanoarchaeota archaeon]MBU1321366.1 50S ribosomal protein L6 [Nanoarchaeota archaeon]MBU1597358.1 50S ribosomal protein L6 [Nanoarchaeota archaeon]MBU2441273.1 50S ribosomal protein L6 [Nanoarchaeota archaeon]
MNQDLREEIEIPEGITVNVEKGLFSVKGEKGEIKRSLHNPNISSKVESNNIVFESKGASKREKKLIKSFAAHLRNMFNGVKEGHVYKLKICSGHFPMSVAVKGKLFEIKNFVGENVPRTIPIPEGVSIQIEGQEVIVEGVEKEITGQTAALIEKKTKRYGFDKRIFQDGIFIIEKDGKPIKI